MSDRAKAATGGWATTAVAAGTAGLLPACARLPNFGAPDPVSKQGERILELWQASVVLGIAVAALVWGLIAYSVIRYRRRNDDVPSQHPHNIPLEIVYTVTPLLIVAVLFAVTVSTQRAVTATPGDPDVVIDVVGFQWQWQFHYPDTGITVTGTPDEDPVMVVPVGRTVRLRLVSNDVVHSFWVPRFLSKRDLIPGLRNEVDVDVKDEGQWVGRCAEFCGLDHYRMRYAVRAVPPDEFDEWVAGRR